MDGCAYCGCKSNDFIILNPTTWYSGIEVAVNRQGMLRVRYYPDSGSSKHVSTDVINIDFCPKCGRKF